MHTTHRWLDCMTTSTLTLAFLWGLRCTLSILIHHILSLRVILRLDIVLLVRVVRNRLALDIINLAHISIEGRVVDVWINISVSRIWNLVLINSHALMVYTGSHILELFLMLGYYSCLHQISFLIYWNVTLFII